MANKFTFRGHHIEVEYTAGATPSLPALTFKRGSVSKSFKPAEIRTDNTALGPLVSVPLVKTVDTGGEIFAFVLPQVDVPGEQTVPVSTVAVFEHFSGPNSVPHRPTTFEACVLEGTAQNAIVPL
jgi:hypothetical protein